jgi:hypothetical protein
MVEVFILSSWRNAILYNCHLFTPSCRRKALAVKCRMCEILINVWSSGDLLLLASWQLIQGVPLATEPGISLIILTPMKILQRNLNRGTFLVWEMKRNVSVVCVCSAPNCCDTEERSASQPASLFPTWRASLLMSLSFGWGCLHNIFIIHSICIYTRFFRSQVAPWREFHKPGEKKV